MENQIQQNQPKNKKWLWWVVGIIGFFIIIGYFSDSGNNSGSIKKIAEQKGEEVLIKVTSFTGSQAGKSDEFTITSKEIKFVYQCDDGLFVCVAWLYQIGGAKQELFRSSGSTGTLSEQKTLSIGPGKFYIKMDTRDRAYKIDVFQSAAAASTEEISVTQTKMDESKRYRSVNGFKLIDENMISGMLRYVYETNDGVYAVDLQVDPRVTNFELESQYNLAKGNLKINGTDIQYAFDGGSKINGVEIIKPYEGVEFTFVAGNKTHVGFARKIKKDSSKESDRLGIESTMKRFLNAIVPDISGDK